MNKINLDRYNLTNDKKNDDWVLKNNTDRVIKRFETKDDALKGGILENAIGINGGSVRIHKQDGTIQEERTFPGNRNPKKSKG